MPFEPLCSIIIPVYNGAQYLRQAVDSALGQSYRNLEVLVVDDGSTDDTAAIARSYGDRITYVHKENGGVATALNEGIRRMRGEYFSWLSHDDVYRPNKLAAQVARLQDGDRDVVLYSDLDLIDTHGAPLGSQSFGGWDRVSMLAALVVDWPVNGCTVLIPKRCIERVGGFDASLRTTQDYDLWFRLAQHYRFAHVPERLILSRLHPGQGTRTVLLHARESNQLYCRALTMQTRESLLSLPGVTTVAEGYLHMAHALTWRKRALAASNFALRLAVENPGTILRRLDAAATLGANLVLTVPLGAIRRLRRYWAMRV